MKLTRARAGKYLSNEPHTLSLFVTACFEDEPLTGLLLFLLLCAPNSPLSPLAADRAKYPDTYSNAVTAANFLVSGRVYTMKIEGHGQAKILAQQEIELLFNKGLQTARDLTLFAVCLYTACRIAEACSLMVKDIYTNSGAVRSTINGRKANTKGKLQTRTIPVIEDLLRLLTSWKPNAGQTYLFPGRC